MHECSRIQWHRDSYGDDQNMQRWLLLTLMMISDLFRILCLDGTYVLSLPHVLDHSHHQCMNAAIIFMFIPGCSCEKLVSVPSMC
jgi:hypothetical protein